MVEDLCEETLFRSSVKSTHRMNLSVNAPANVISGLISVIALVLSLYGAPSLGSTADKPTRVKVAEQALELALNSLALQLDQQLIMVSEDVGSLRGRPVDGTYTDEEALTIVLEGSGLEYRRINENTIAVGSPDRLSTIAAGGADQNRNESLVVAQADRANASDSLSAEKSQALGGGPPIEEIVVTALKRGSRSLIDTGAGVSVIDGNLIDEMGADTLIDVLQFSPATSIDTSTFGEGLTSIQIRGINTTFGSASVGYYLDDLPFSLINVNILPDPNPYDLESVEVLRGPQGTLYGAGSSGGVVLVNTRDPDLENVEFKADVTGSSTKGGGENYSGSAAINIPIVEDRLGLRLVSSYQNNDGWIDLVDGGDDDRNGTEKETYRIKLRAAPVEPLTIDLLADFSRIDSDGSPISDDAGFDVTDFEKPTETDYDLYGAVIEYRFPWFVVRNSTAYIDFTSDFESSNLVPTPTSADVDTIANEIRLNSNLDGPLSWVAGFFYRDADQDIRLDLSNQGFPANVADDSNSEQYAIFGEASLSLFEDRLEVTAGISYFEDDVETDTDLSPIPVVTGNGVESDLYSPKLNILYRPNDDSSIYFNYGQGFRSGTLDFGISTFFAQQLIPSLTGQVDSENHNAFEIGFKGTFMDARLYAEIIGFWTDISDVQQSAAIAVPNTDLVLSTVINAGDAVSSGVEWLFDFRPLDGLHLTLSGSYTNAEIDGDFFAEGQDPSTSVPLFADGTRLNLVPEWLASGSVTYTRDIGHNLSGTAFASFQYASDRELTVLSASSIEGDNNTRVDTRLEVGRDNWSVFLFADNVLDDDSAISPAQDNVTAPVFGVPINGLVATRYRPRTIGAGFRLRY